MKFSGNVYLKIVDNAASDPQRTLFGVENEDLSGLDFIRSTKLYSRALIAAGCRINDKIGMVLPNSVSWFSIYWAIVRIGCIPVPFDPQAGEWELKSLLKLTECKLCFVKATYRANNILRNLENILVDLPALSIVICTDCSSGSANGSIISLDRFLYMHASDQKEVPVYQPESDAILMMACTSGSTGNPKIIAVPHLGFAQAQKDMADYLGFCKSDIMLLGMPLYHQGGFGMGLQMILNGGTVRYQPQFDPVAFLNRIEQEKITVLQLTATLAKILLSVPEFDNYNIKSVRIVYFAGEKLPMEIAQEFFEKRGIRVVNIIGSTETATMVIWDSDFDKSVDVNDFRSLAFTEFMICNDTTDTVDVNETGLIYVHTDALLKEYYANPVETGKKLPLINGKRWFNTGDLGKRLSDGRVRFEGRAKRIIKRGSNLVCPEENEAFLLTHPYIEAVAVCGEKHELFGEMIVAYVQTRKNYTLNRGDIVKFCQGKLAAYKIPDKVVFLTEIPHDIGKVQYKYI